MRQPVADRRTTVQVVRPDELPEPLRSASGLDRIDYADVATARTPGAARWTPEQWTRAAVERGPLVRLGGPLVWRGIVGLRLGARRAPGHVAGWRIGARGAEWVRLEAASWHVTAHVLVYVAEDRVAVALLVRHDRPAAALLWPPVAVLHRRGIPKLLRQAQRLLAREEPSGT
jgi:hypothetical protein